MENHKVEFIVVRASISELTFARIDATVTREELTREVVFLKALQGALTQWAAGTSEGKEAWEDSSEDFNVGDLSYEIGDESMKPYLEKAGIAYLNIGVECHVIRTLAWSYDTVLMDRETLKAERGGVVVIKLRSKRSGPHVHEDVFVGPDKDHMGLAGRLTFSVGEWQLFGAALKLGASKTGGQLEVVFEGDREVVEGKPDEG